MKNLLLLLLIAAAAVISVSAQSKDKTEAQKLLEILEREIIPLYYDHPDKWQHIVTSSIKDVLPYFDSGRMADEYYEKLYHS